MLSIILYGRNDSHGYNLHKRAALSLNCLAEMLTAPGDEIIFVDYNTPDDLPTFPESIRDTLTAAARARLRVLRIRPRHHEPFRPFTHLPILEPVARNAAIRRADPGNRWILSTNTDMIFVPRAGGISLSEMVADLEPACHHLPRCELPEMLWEGFDRLDPTGVIASLRDLGPRLHLDEIVYGSPPALYDNHGDFQLMPRAAAEAVCGFDERMRNGWIVDSNMARRLMLRLGPPRSLYPHFIGYHCDHTRVPSLFHGRSHVENDYHRFYVNVDRPEVPGQEDRWGLAGTELEEIRLDRDPAAALAALARLLPPAPEKPPEVTYNPEVFDLAYYPAEHVLPFLCDLLLPADRRSTLAWFGTRPHLLDMAASLWREMGFTGPLLVPSTAQEERDALERADLFLFEFGAASQDETPPRTPDWHEDDLTKLAPVRAAFLALVEEEVARIAEGAAPRMVITVNAVHNRFETLVHDCLAIPRAPFSTRIRHGQVLTEPPPAETAQMTPPALARWLGRRLNRRDVPITEAVRLLSYVEEILAARPATPRLRAMLRAAGCLEAALDHPAVRRFKPAESITQAQHWIAAERGAHRLAPLVTLPMVPALPPAATHPSRLANVEDWEDESWLRLARRFFMGAFAANTFNRSATQWARIHMLDQIRRSGRDLAGLRVLLTAAGPEPLADALSALGSQVRVAGPYFPGNGLRVPSGVRFDETPSPCDVALLFPGTVFPDGDLERGTARLAAAAAVLASGGLLAFAEEGTIGLAAPDQFSASLPFTESFLDVLGRLGLSPLPMAPAALSAATLDHAAGAEETALPHFVREGPGGPRVIGAWFFVKTT